MSTIFHKIIRKEIPADIVYEDDKVIAFRDVNPVAPSHILVVPKTDIVNLNDATTENKEVLGHMLFILSQIAKDHGLKENGYRVVINNGEFAGQTVFQLHMHLLSGREFSWPPG